MTDIDEARLLALAAARGDVLVSDRLVLYAGANLPSAAAQAAYSPALSAYPAMGRSFFKEQPDTDLVSELEVAVRAEICGLFGAAWAEPRLPSCTIANLAVFHAYAKPGDLLLAPAAAHGGHLSQRRGGTPELAGLRVEDLAFDTANCRLDALAAARQIRALRPRLVMLGRSVMIQPDDIGPVVEAARETGATTIFDASHVAGLIAGGTFPNPLDLGVDVLTSSTYKTLPGRPHSLIAGRDPDQGARLARLIDEKFLANYDAGRLPSFLVTLRETRLNGQDYARRICANTEALAEGLRSRGVEIIAPVVGECFTHQILIPMDAGVPAASAVVFFQEHDILVGTCADPKKEGYALRIGTQFLTSLGEGPAKIRDVARLLSELLVVSDAGRMTLKSERRIPA